MSWLNNQNPIGSVQDAADLMWKLDQFQNTSNTAAIRALLERESAKGSANAKALAALLRKHTCYCVQDKGRRATKLCMKCVGKKWFLESEIPFKDRRNLEPLKMPCKDCNGSGSRDGRTACSTCNGTGEEDVYGRRWDGRLTKERRMPAHDGKERVYKCPNCNGTGEVPNHCIVCNDTGIMKRDEYERELKRIEDRYR